MSEVPLYRESWIETKQHFELAPNWGPVGDKNLELKGGLWVTRT